MFNYKNRVLACFQTRPGRESCFSSSNTSYIYIYIYIIYMNAYVYMYIFEHIYECIRIYI